MRLSSGIQQHRDARVVEWLRQEREHCYTSSIVIAQLAYWVRTKPGRQRDALQQWLTRLIEAMQGRIRGRIRGFNVSVAKVWADLQHQLDEAGQRMPIEDSYIAATALRYGLTIVTGNERHFRRPGHEALSVMSKGKIALVTGGNRGIGKEIVRQLAAKEFRVVLTARDPKGGAQTESALKGEVEFLALDVADDESIAQAAENFGKRSDRLDVLVNNAGIYPDEGFNILTVSRELLIKTFQTNTFGAIRVIQTFLPFLSRADQARIVNLSSGYGELGGLSSDVPSYCLSKLTLNGATIMFDQMLHNRGIAVNAVCPGWVRTDMGGPNAPNAVEEGADTAVWLATDAPHSLSGKFFRRRREISW